MSIKGFSVGGNVERYDYNSLDNLPSEITIDPALSGSSTNPVQNKVVTGAINATTDSVNALSGEVSDLKSALNENDARIAAGLKYADITWQNGWINSSGVYNPNDTRFITTEPLSSSKIRRVVNKSSHNCWIVYFNSFNSFESFSFGTVAVVNINSATTIDTTYPYFCVEQDVRNPSDLDSVYAEYNSDYTPLEYLSEANMTQMFNAVGNNTEKLDEIVDLSLIPFSETINFANAGSKTIPVSFLAGDSCNISVTISGTTTDSGQKNLQVYDGDNTRLAIYYGSTEEKLVFNTDTTSLKFVVSRTGTWTDFAVSIVISKASTTELQHVYYVEKDGTGDFTKLVDAIAVAETYEGSVVYVGAGTWDILSELGDTYLNAVSSNPSTWGVELKNNIHLIFSTQTVVTANYTGTNENVMKYLSVFNSGEKGFTLENCTIRSSKIRYCVHDDRGSMTTPYRNRYINCDMYHDNSGNTAFGGWQCIGGGFGYNGDITIDGCYFDASNQYANTGGVVSFHNSAQANAQSKLTIKNSYCAGNFTFRVSWYGTSPKTSAAYICGCSIGAEIVHVAENSSATVQNTEVIAWNNDIRTA